MIEQPCIVQPAAGGSQAKQIESYEGLDGLYSETEYDNNTETTKSITETKLNLSDQ